MIKKEFRYYILSMVSLIFIWRVVIFVLQKRVAFLQPNPFESTNYFSFAINLSYWCAFLFLYRFIWSELLGSIFVEIRIGKRCLMQRNVSILQLIFAASNTLSYIVVAVLFGDRVSGGVISLILLITFIMIFLLQKSFIYCVDEGVSIFVLATMLLLIFHFTGYSTR
ncbi:hypothetical protein [Lactobacillus sp. UCMA15818]|uniref:hypothetical protein n=1 Tax=Lactobacillus sp. UCMA15818 TaxID=2583394 RepID=UPI0025B09135|nr:hypothetical protein [Lactobacillus sp. UCMA15818]MDN2452802.1 hypothetical protein [Lactobacillus sp. UCMA15818]